MTGFQLHVLSLGAGIQSTTVALMAAHGEITPMPDCAIFADTGWEPKAVYAHLKWLTGVLPFPVHTVSAGSILENIKTGHSERSGKFLSVPYFTADGGIGRRQCTSNYKIEPIQKKVRELLGLKPRQRSKFRVKQWIGISLDEATRMKPAQEAWIEHRWPLIELRMHRWDCLRWMERKSYPVPSKSSCIGCPFHSDSHWREMRDNAPEEWAEAVAIDKHIRHRGDTPGVVQYTHSQRIPLDEVDLSTAEDHGQLNLFINECEGMCGV